jgi:hypothetical protein
VAIYLHSAKVDMFLLKVPVCRVYSVKVIQASLCGKAFEARAELPERTFNNLNA